MASGGLAYSLMGCVILVSGYGCGMYTVTNIWLIWDIFVLAVAYYMYRVSSRKKTGLDGWEDLLIMEGVGSVLMFLGFFMPMFFGLSFSDFGPVMTVLWGGVWLLGLSLKLSLFPFPWLGPVLSELGWGFDGVVLAVTEIMGLWLVSTVGFDLLGGNYMLAFAAFNVVMVSNLLSKGTGLRQTMVATSNTVVALSLAIGLILGTDFVVVFFVIRALLLGLLQLQLLYIKILLNESLLTHEWYAYTASFTTKSCEFMNVASLAMVPFFFMGIVGGLFKMSGSVGFLGYLFFVALMFGVGKTLWVMYSKSKDRMMLCLKHRDTNRSLGGKPGLTRILSYYGLPHAYISAAVWFYVSVLSPSFLGL